MYEDSLAHCRETLQEHRKKYTETALAQRYYKKKEEVEEIQKRVLKHFEKYRWKEDPCLDILGTAIVNAFTIKPFDLALHIKGAIQETSNFPQFSLN